MIFNLRSYCRNRLSTQLAIYAPIISCLGICCLVSSMAHSADASNRFSFSGSYIDNIGLASAEADQMSDTVLEIEASRSYRQTLDLSQALFYGANFTARDYQDYPCDRFTFGLQFGYEKKLGLGFDKPRLHANWNGSRNIYAEDSLNGFSSEFSLGVSKPFGERWDTRIQVTKLWEIPDRSPDTFGLPDTGNNPPAGALDQETTSLELSTEFYATPYWSFPVSVSYTDGDMASVARLSPAALQYADAISNDEGLGPDWFVLRSEGDAWSANVGASRLLGDGSLLNVEFAYIDANTRGNIQYDRQSLTISWVKNW